MVPLSTVYPVLSTRYHSPITTHHSPLTTHHSPLTTHHSPLTTHHSPLTRFREGIMAEDLIGNYRLVKCLLTGQMSQVWEVVETSSHRHFAMKLLLPEKGKDSEAKGMLYHEAKVGLELTHPNVIRIVHVSDESVHHYFVMEFFPSGSLKDRL